MTKRAVRWQFLYALLAAFSMASLCLAAGPLFTHQQISTIDGKGRDAKLDDASNQREFSEVYHTLSYPSILTGKASTMTITNLMGVTTTSNASAGSVGEYLSSTLDRNSAVTLTTTVAKTVTSLTLTAGDWNISGAIGFGAGQDPTATQIRGGISSTTDTLPPDANLAAPSSTTGQFGFIRTYAAGIKIAEVTEQFPTWRVSLNSTTTLYLIASSVFSAGGNAAYGYIGARRMR